MIERRKSEQQMMTDEGLRYAGDDPELMARIEVGLKRMNAEILRAMENREPSRWRCALRWLRRLITS